jgi:hypothetical protein
MNNKKTQPLQPNEIKPLPVTIKAFLIRQFFPNGLNDNQLSATKKSSEIQNTSVAPSLLLQTTPKT